MLETSPVLGTATEMKLINEWREFRDFEGNKKKAKQKYETLLKNIFALWEDCNELARQKNWVGKGILFKPTTKTVSIPLKLHDLTVKNRDDFGSFIKMIYILVYESSAEGERVPKNVEVSRYMDILQNLRHHFEHDREHGKQSAIHKKFMTIGRIFEELIGKQPSNEHEWYLLQIAVLLRVKAMLTIIIEEINKTNLE